MPRLLFALTVFLLAVPAQAQQPVPPGVPFALIAQHSGLCLDVEGGATAAGARLVQTACDAEEASQVFTFSRADSGYLTLSPVHTGLCVGVGGGSTDAAADVTQYACHGGENQQMRAQRNDDGTYTLTARHSGACLGIGEASKAAGAGATQWTCHGGPNQRWYVYPLGTRVPVRNPSR